MDKIPSEKLIIVALIIIAAYMSPFIILGEDTPVLVHDNLDSNLVRHITLVQSGKIFGSMDSTVPQIMNGLPRNCLGSEFSFILLLFDLFPPFTAYALNLTFMHFIAFFGMYLLLSRHIVREKEYSFIAVGVALCFALLPFWPFGGLSIAGMPLALYAFLNIRNRDYSYKDWLIICILPFYSSLALSFFFFLTAMGFLWFIDFIRKKDANLHFLGAICLMTGIFLLVEYRLVYGMFFDSSYISQRVEFGSSGDGLIKCIITAGGNFIYGQYHAVSLHSLWIGISIIISLLLVQFKFFGKKLNASNKLSYSVLFTIGLICLALFFGFGSETVELSMIWGMITLIMGLLILQITFKPVLKTVFENINKKSSRFKISSPDSESYQFISLLFICFAIALIYGFWNWNSISPIKEQIMILKSFNFSRFHFLHPLLWYMLFSMSLKIIIKNLKYGKHVVVILLLLQAGYLFSFSSSDVYQPGGIGLLKSGQMTYEEFYSPDLFNEIATYIGEPQESYRVVSIGIHPSVSQYNGFYSLDSYKPNYPLEYKHEFRRLIEKELEKDKEIQEYFDYWGSRCYVFTAEKKKDSVITKDKSSPITNLEFNTEAFEEMGGKYIISAVEIKNYEDNNLEFMRTFENDKSSWKIWLYYVK
ncbi:DUF6044 family protein [Methanosarcina sp. WWM596]|uniref:DUF6044 family protein n=1 Tax=Methanosarcina sp. WWM596 TaxID=1434103 RepID=UPI000615BABD|nr:DUF6044 family protein [Methanosarcina sp. WWM596]AKB18844.1 hypothetical protein MSWHS_1981 [Methanosarcina sp. WWM596]